MSLGKEHMLHKKDRILGCRILQNHSMSKFSLVRESGCGQIHKQQVPKLCLLDVRQSPVFRVSLQDASKKVVEGP